MKLSREGYGSIEEIKRMPVNEFFNLIHYENFLTQYKEVFRLLNTKK